MSWQGMNASGACRRGSGRALASVQLVAACALGDPAAGAQELLATYERLVEDTNQPAPHHLLCALVTAAGTLVAASPVVEMEVMKSVLNVLYTPRFGTAYSPDGCLITLQQLKVCFFDCWRLTLSAAIWTMDMRAWWVLQLQAGALQRWLAADGVSQEEAGEVVAGMNQLLGYVAELVEGTDEKSKESYHPQIELLQGPGTPVLYCGWRHAGRLEAQLGRTAARACACKR